MNTHNIISIGTWADTETTSVIEVVVGTDVDNAMLIADRIYDALVGFDESVGVYVCGVDVARYRLERNQEVVWWK